ncbi:hypothetical protein JCM8547_006809 [Rhodosporidiobolus lusitaniae]
MKARAGGRARALSAREFLKESFVVVRTSLRAAAEKGGEKSARRPEEKVAASAPSESPDPLKFPSVQAGSAQHQTATPSSAPTIPTSNLANNAGNAASSDKKKQVAEAVLAYYKAAHLEEAGGKGQLVRTLFSDQSIKAISPALVRSSARETLSVEKEVPKGFIRFTIPVPKAKTVGQEKGVHVTRVRHELLSHFDGDNHLAPLVEVPEDVPYKSLLGLTTGARLHRVLFGHEEKVSAHEIDVSFASESAFNEHAAPSVLKNLVELRLELHNLNTSDKAIFEGIKAIVKSKDYELVAVQKYYHASETASGNPVLTFQGRISSLLHFPSLAKDAARAHHQHLESILPTSMVLDGRTLPLRHDFESSFYVFCRFAGHTGGTALPAPAPHVGVMCTLLASAQVPVPPSFSSFPSETPSAEAAADAGGRDKDGGVDEEADHGTESQDEELEDETIANELLTGDIAPTQTQDSSNTPSSSSSLSSSD